MESTDRNSTRIDELAERVHYLEEENKMLKMKQTDSENRDKRSNIVMQGISEDIQDTQLEAEFQRICVQHLKIDKDITVERIHRIGSKTKGGRPRAVVVKLLCFKDRELIWENWCNLKGSSLFLEEHFAVDIQQKRFQLLPYLQSARKRGEKAFLAGDKLVVNGHRYNAEPLDLWSLQLQYGNTLERSQLDLETDNGPAICFYGKHSPFSNYYWSPVEISGKKFNSNEHFYTYRKCQLADRPDLAFRAERAHYPAEATAIGHPVKLENDLRIELMRSGLMAKFAQNSDLKQILLGTGDKLLAEASPIDLFWGTGCGLQSENLKKPSTWRGQNEMGKLLMKLRSEFRED